MARISTYRVHYKISGWVEVEARSADDALDEVSDKDAVALVEDSIKCSWDLDEVELNP